MQFRPFILTALLLVACAAPARAEKLIMLYPDMAPFIAAGVDQDKPAGFMADRVEAVTAAGGVEMVWQGPIPRARILRDLERANHSVCVPNARLTVDRRAKFVASDPLFPVPDWVVVGRSGDQRLAQRTLAELLKDERLRFGRLQDVSLGQAADLASAAGVNVYVVRGPPTQLFQLLEMERIDYAVADTTSFEALKDVGIDPVKFAIHRAADLVAEEAGRFLCSKSTPPEIINRLSAGIAAVGQTRPKKQ